MKRSWRRVIAFLAAASIASAQLALASYACPTAVAEAAAVAATMDASSEGTACVKSALCHKHCQAEKQKPADPLPYLGLLGITPILLTRLETPDSPALALASAKLLHLRPPSLAIQHCCLRL